MKDYANIITKINQTPWLITPEGLDIVMKIVTERIERGRLEDEEVDNRLQNLRSTSGRPTNEDGLQIINGVGILPVMGPIFGKANLMTRVSGATSLESFQQDFRSMLKDDGIGSIIMEFDTPGGTSDLVEEMASEIYASRGIKPIYASVNTMCGSAGLFLASQANKIFSTQSGSIGSLGAYSTHIDQSGADAKEGVKYTYISAGQYKTEGNPHEALSSEAIRHRQESITELYDTFAGAVAKGRGEEVETVKASYGQGRMLTAKKALEVGMIDGVMSFDELLSNLTKNQPRQVHIHMPGNESPIAATMVGDTVYYGVDFGPEVPSLIEAITRHTKTDPSSQLEFSINPKSIRREDDEMKLSAEALKALGLPEDATEDQISAAITAMHSELNPLKDLRAAIDGQKKFSTEYPEEYARMQSLELTNRKTEAKIFADSYKSLRFSDVKVETVDGEDKETITATTKGLSGLALQKIEDVSLMFVDGTVTLSDYKASLDAIMCGIVDYGTKGSDKGNEPEEQNLAPAGNIFEIRSKFANMVVEVMEKDSLDEDAAIKVVAEKNPKMWEIYKNPQLLAAK